MAGAVAPPNDAVLASVDSAHTGSASGFNSAMSRIGACSPPRCSARLLLQAAAIALAVTPPLSRRHHRDGRFDKRIRTGARTPLRTSTTGLCFARQTGGIRFAQESTKHRKERQSFDRVGR